MIEPAELKDRQIKRGIVGELSFAGVAEIFAAVDPRSNDESLQTLLVLPLLGEIHIRDRRAP